MLKKNTDTEVQVLGDVISFLSADVTPPYASFTVAAPSMEKLACVGYVLGFLMFFFHVHRPFLSLLWDGSSNEFQQSDTCP